MSVTIVQRFVENLKEVLSNEQVIVEDGKVKVIIGDSIAEIKLDVNKLVDVLLREYKTYRESFEKIKARLEELKNRLFEILHELGSPELVSYIRHKLYGGRPGFSLGVKISGDKVYLYKVISRAGTKRWHTLGLSIDYYTWDLIKSLVDDILELKSIMSSFPEKLRNIYDPIYELATSLNVIRDILYKLYPSEQLACMNVETPEEEDEYYIRLLELEAALLRRRKSTHRRRLL